VEEERIRGGGGEKEEDEREEEREDKAIPKFIITEKQKSFYIPLSQSCT